MSLKKEDIARVKGMGFLLNRGTECFSGRVVPIAGQYTAENLKTISECAEKCGNGTVVFTSRLCAEIVGIPYEKIDEAIALLAKGGMQFGGTGAKVRPLTCCKGSTCVYGNIDTYALTKVLHERFYVEMGKVKMPHKFKIGVGGCPNSCMKPSLNDVGIEGHKVFTFDADKCRNCRVCNVAKSCPIKAVSIVDGKAVIDADKCLMCGVCVGKCPFGAVPAEAMAVCRIYAGGTWGKSTRIGTPLKEMIPVEKVPEMVEKIMLWYRENGYEKERLGKAIDHVGVEAFEKAVSGDDLILRREEILAAPIKVKE